ncbi:MAG: toll/interleukin-1 receptor domain-containing protein, partial [Candidatus Thorarchaeota archaeon]
MSLHRVFISYSTEDRNIAYTVCSRLENEKIKCWIAPRDIPPQENYARAIIAAIRSSETILFFFSKSAFGSPHIITELDRGLNYRKPILTIRLDDIQPLNIPPEIEYLTSTSQGIDAWDKPIDLYINDIISTIEKIGIKSPIVTEKQSRLLPYRRPILPESISIIKMLPNFSERELINLSEFYLLNNKNINLFTTSDLSLEKWKKDTTIYFEKIKRNELVFNWAIHRMEIFLNNPHSLSNIYLIDSLLISPPEKSIYDKVLYNLEEQGRAGIIGAIGVGKKFFVTYLAYNWAMKTENPILYMENVELWQDRDWNNILESLANFKNNYEMNKKVLIIFSFSKIDDLENNFYLNNLLNLSENNPISVLFVGCCKENL